MGAAAVSNFVPTPACLPELRNRQTELMIQDKHRKPTPTLISSISSSPPTCSYLLLQLLACWEGGIARDFSIAHLLSYQGHTHYPSGYSKQKYQPPVFARNTGLGFMVVGVVGFGYPLQPAAPTTMNPNHVFRANTGGWYFCLL